MLFRTTPYYLLTHPGFRKNPSLFIFRALLWRLKCALGMSTTVSLPTLRAKLYLPATRNGEGTTMLYAAREHFEPELLRLNTIVPANRASVDVGANIGIYTLALARLSSQVFSFEPTPETFDTLQRNIELNSLENVKAFRLAISDRAGSVRLYHNPKGSGSNSIAARADTYEEVTATTLDEAISPGIKIGFMKIDVQGAEEMVLKGAQRILLEDRPIIQFEIDADASLVDPLAAYNLLHSYGYRFSIIDQNGNLKAIEEPVDDKNIMAFHVVDQRIDSTFDASALERAAARSHS